MKVLVFAPNYFPATRYGGPVRSSHGLAKALVERGHHIEVFTTNVDGPNVLDVPLDRAVELDGVLVRYFPIATPRRIYRSPALEAALRFALPQADVLHVNGMFLWPGPAAGRMAARAKLPTIISPRGMLMPDMVKGKSRLAKMVWIAALERQSLSRAAFIHVTSEEEAQGLRDSRLDLAPLALIGNGVDLPERLPTETEMEEVWRGIPRGRRVAFLGRLDWTKGVDLAVEAVRRVEGATMLIGGPDQIGLRATLEYRLVRENGTTVARFLGAVDGTTKWALLAGADVVVAPSIRESFGIAIAEAMAVGTTVLCSAGVGLAPAIARIDAGCVVARDVDSLGRQLVSLLENYDRRRRFGAAARILMASEFGWAAIASRMESTYCDAVKGARHAH